MPTNRPRIPVDRFRVTDPNEDIDTAHHHAMCRCAECDPDLAYELRRDARFERAS